MTVPVTPMRLGPLFDRAIRTIGLSFLRNAAIGAVVLVPAAALVYLAISHFEAGAFAVITEAAVADPWHVIARLAGAAMLIFGALLAFGAASMLALTAMMRVAAAVFEERDLTWHDALYGVLGMPWLKQIGAMLLQGLAIAGIVLVPVLLMIAGRDSPVALALAGVLGFAGAGTAIVWLSVRWLFLNVVIACEDDAVVHAFARSASLVRGYWWRTFGISLLFSMMAQIAVSIVSMPVGFIALAGMYKELFTAAFTTPDGQIPASSVRPIVESALTGYGIMILFSSLCTQILQACYLVAMYFDLRARKGEFPSADAAAGDAVMNVNDVGMSGID